MENIIRVTFLDQSHKAICVEVKEQQEFVQHLKERLSEQAIIELQDASGFVHLIPAINIKRIEVIPLPP